MDRLNENDLNVVYESVFYARAKWYNIGLKLNIPCSDLEVYRNLRPDDALRDILRYWLRRTNPAPTMNKLIEALRSPTVVEQPEQRGMLQRKLHIMCKLIVWFMRMC